MTRSCRSPYRCWSSLPLVVLAISSLPVAESFTSSSIRTFCVKDAQSAGFKARPCKELKDFGSSKVPRIRLSSDTVVNNEVELTEQYDPNGIEPETKSITGSMAFFAKFVIKTMITNRLQNAQKKSVVLKKRRGARRKSFLENVSRLNEQRKNLVTLAGYNAHIVVPSFAFLLLGAITTSIVPLYESKCIQLVATLHPTKAGVVEALVGLVVSSTLASLFTGLRGSLFWLAGTFPYCIDLIVRGVSTVLSYSSMSSLTPKCLT